MRFSAPWMLCTKSFWFADQALLVLFGVWQKLQLAESLRCPAWKSGPTPSVTWQALLYDHALLGKPPETWDELLAVARKYPGKIGFKAAQYDYTVRRYDSEARHNQRAAALYEVEIRKASVNSESHRQRSRHFFYGMLVAQAGVTIASFSLAVKHRSALWALAAMAGVCAVAFSGYVYLYVRPG